MKIGFVFMTVLTIAAVLLDGCASPGDSINPDTSPTIEAKLETTLQAYLEVSDNATTTAELSAEQAHSGKDSIRLETVASVGTGDEARIEITLPAGTTLGDIESISWWAYLQAGYPPHLDILLDQDNDGIHEGYCIHKLLICQPEDDILAFDYAYNSMGHFREGASTAYGALTGDWYQVFSDDGNGPTRLDDMASAFPGSFADLPPITMELHTLADWKAGKTYTSEYVKTVDADTSVTGLVIKVDNWIAQTEAYVDDIEIVIGGVTYTIGL